MGRAMAKEDSGRTPLTDMMERMAMEFGLPSTFTPDYDPGSPGQGTSESSRQFAPKQQYEMADPNNPRYRLNSMQALYRALGSDPLRNKKKLSSSSSSRPRSWTD